MKSGEIMIVADTKIYCLDEIFNACLIQENSFVKIFNIFLEEKERTDLELSILNLTIFRDTYLIVCTVHLNIQILESSP